MGLTCSLQRISENELDELLQNPAYFEEFCERKVSASHFCGIDKAWHGLHFLFTGTAYKGEEPLCFLLVGGTLVAGEYEENAMRALRPAQVKDFSGAISQLSPEELRARFDPAAMTEADIYPEIWERDPREDDTFGYLLQDFHSLRKFLEKAAAANDAVLISIG